MIGYARDVSDSSLVVVATCRDSAEATMIRAVLTAHEIPVHVSGDGSAVGIGNSGASPTVRVPRELADDARALIEEMRSGGEAALADDEIPEDDTAERADELTPDGALVRDTDAAPEGSDTVGRLKPHNRVALALATGIIVGHGTAHMSVRAWKRGFVLLAVQVLGWWTLFTRDARQGALIVVATVLCDIVGALVLIGQTPAPLPVAKARKPD